MPEQSKNDSNNKPSLARRLIPSKTRLKSPLFIAAALVVIAGLGFVGYKVTQKDPNKLGKVGDHIVTKNEIQDTLKAGQQAGFYPESEDQIRTLAMNYWLYLLIAKEYNIQVGDQEAIDGLKTRITTIKAKPSLDINNQYVRYLAYTNVLESKLGDIINTPRSGAYVLAHFSQNLVQATPELKALSKEKYDALLAADKKYATDFINNVSAKLKGGTMTFDQAIELEKNDPKIGQKILPTFVHSSKFGKAESTTGGAQEVSKISDIQSKIESLKAGETSDPFVIKVQTTADQDSSKVDGIWVIVKVDTDNAAGPQFDTINAALQHFKQKYGYEVYN
jgi:hypothetical protein